jgi:hydroxyacylglutathione hydrolase
MPPPDAAPRGTILDVRSRREFDAGHVPGAQHLPFWAVVGRASRMLGSRNEPITVYCAHGPRAWIAKGMLRVMGFRRVRLMKGHMRAWIKARKPLA